MVESKSTLTEQFPDTVAKLQRLALVERIFDDMNNGFGWARLPKSFMAENTVFLLLTAIIRNFYKFLMGRHDPCIITSVLARLSSDGEANCKNSQHHY